MIYITIEDDHDDTGYSVSNVYEIDSDNVVEEYKLFILEQAKEMNIVINPYWLNIMNYQDHNNHLSKSEYNRKSKEWPKLRNTHTIDNYIRKQLSKKPMPYKIINT